MLVTLSPGLYTVHLSGAGSTSGIGLAEVFEASNESIETRLMNISTRILSSTGDRVAIGGFVIMGQDPKRVLIRALGPELANRGISEYMPNPEITLYEASEAVARNDDWGDEPVFQLQEAFSQAGASALPLDSQDVAMIRELQPCLYTVVVNDFDGEDGIALIEIFELP